MKTRNTVYKFSPVLRAEDQARAFRVVLQTLGLPARPRHQILRLRQRGLREACHSGGRRRARPTPARSQHGSGGVSKGLRLGCGGRHVGRDGVLDHGVAAQAQPTGDLRPQDTCGIHLAYIIRPAAQSSPPSFPDGSAWLKTPPKKTIWRGPPPEPQGAALMLFLINS